jgi:Domain of unknown function (DUF4440)
MVAGAEFFLTIVRPRTTIPDTAMKISLRLAMVTLPRPALPGVLCCFLLVCCGPVGAKSIPHPHRQPKEVVHIIQGLELRLQQAQLSGNIAVMATLLSDDYLGIYADGTLATKADTLASFKNGTVHYTAIHTFDRKIRVYGSTAVVTSKANVTGINDGNNITGEYRYTRVYHRTNRVWKIVSFEASSIQKHQHAH